MSSGKGKKQNLGRGLDALFGESDQEAYADVDRLRQSKTLGIEFLQPSRYQPRRSFDDEEMQQLVDSVREKGVLQPLLVRRHPEDPNSYEIVAGERRWRAAQQAQLHEVPVVVKELGERDALEIAIIENVQRSDLTALEEAQGYRRLIDEFAYGQAELAQALGKSRSYVANMLRLLTLPRPVQTMVSQQRLSAGHARALIGADDPEAVAGEVERRGLTVRQTEELVRGGAEPRHKAAPKSGGGKAQGGKGAGSSKDAGKDADTRALETEISNYTGLQVSITPRGSGGDVTIRYDSLEQLDDLLGRLSGQKGQSGKKAAE